MSKPSKGIATKSVDAVDAMPATSRTVELHTAGFAGLLGAAVAVSMAYGVTLPLLSSLLARLIGPADAGEVVFH